MYFGVISVTVHLIASRIESQQFNEVYFGDSELNWTIKCTVTEIWSLKFELRGITVKSADRMS